MASESFPERCDTCGCVLTFRPARHQESLATPEQRKALYAAARAARAWSVVERGLAGCGWEISWVLAFACPGCGLRGTRFLEQFAAEEEAEARAAAQNRAAEAPEAQEAVLHWKAEVRRRAGQDARAFHARVRARLPDLNPEVGWIEAGASASGASPHDVEWDCALVVTLPWPNPAASEPLEVRVLGREIRLSWGPWWHVHLCRAPGAAPGDSTHVEEAVQLLADLVGERLVIAYTTRGGEALSGGLLPAGAEPPLHWLPGNPGIEPTRLEMRSWRGTFDGTTISPGTPPPGYGGARTPG